MNRFISVLVVFLISQAIYSQVDREGKDFALIFAINDYEDSSLEDLQNPINEAVEVAKILREKYGFKVELLKNPTYQEIDEKLEEYKDFFEKRKQNADEQLLLFFSGHGELINRNGYFLPSNADADKIHNSSMMYAYLRPIIDEIQCPHLLVVIDACYSGTFDPNWGSRDNKKRRFRRIGEDRKESPLLANHKETESRILFSAAYDDKTPDKSTFAYHLRKGLLEGGGQDRILTSTELFARLQYARPNPYAASFGKDDPGSSFLFFDQSTYHIENSSPDLDLPAGTLPFYCQNTFKWSSWSVTGMGIGLTIWQQSRFTMADKEISEIVDQRMAGIAEPDDEARFDNASSRFKNSQRTRNIGIGLLAAGMTGTFLNWLACDKTKLEVGQTHLRLHPLWFEEGEETTLGQIGVKLSLRF